MREKNEAAAHSVVRQLAELGISATVAGSGLHWRIEVAAVRGRSIRAHCFWYESAITGLMLGMNRANARASLRAEVTPYDGLELATALLLDGVSVADGRTRTVPDFLAACRAWIAGATLDEMVTAARNLRISRISVVAPWPSSASFTAADARCDALRHRVAVIRETRVQLRDPHVQVPRSRRPRSRSPRSSRRDHRSRPRNPRVQVTAIRAFKSA